MKLKRTRMCGELRATHVGERVVVSGWVDNIREIGGLVFVVLRDREGVVQLVFDKERVPDLLERAKRLGREHVVAAGGSVTARSRDQVNPKLATGEVDVAVEELELLNVAKTPPMEVRDDVDFDKELRFKYRYIDLRRPQMQHTFRLRHRLIKTARDYFDDHGFLEIETPLLTKPTPEGARDFLVPSRLLPGQFYALPQSPQIFKQILMMSGFDRYVQFARCLRDEDKRGDRQPEHTQLDLEMSFVEPGDVQGAVEGCVARVMQKVLGVEVPLPLPHLRHTEAMGRYGSDKPDTRFALETVDLSEDLRDCAFGVFATTISRGGVVKFLRIPGGHAMVSKGQFKGMEREAKGMGAKGLIAVRYPPEGVDSPIAKFLSETELSVIREKTEAHEGDLVLAVADTPHVTSLVLSHFRLLFGERLGLRSGERFHYLWVDNFPQFEYDEENNRILAAHHPFVAPEDEDALVALADELRRTNHEVTPPIVDLATSIRATQYDLVVNGVELGSGSVRITKKPVQDAMFECIGLGPQEAEAKFGFLLEALSYGAPPMAGIGIGVDRWLMVLLGLDTLQEVIAFPKTSAGKGLMDGCPAEADPDLLAELKISVDATAKPFSGKSGGA